MPRQSSPRVVLLQGTRPLSRKGSEGRNDRRSPTVALLHSTHKLAAEYRAERGFQSRTFPWRLGKEWNLQVQIFDSLHLEERILPISVVKKMISTQSIGNHS